MLKYVLASVFLLAGCEEMDRGGYTEQERQVSSYSAGLIYMKDARTNLCFATCSNGYNIGSLTNVPCSPEVLKLVK